MPIGKRMKEVAKKQTFKPGGKYFQRKAAIGAGKIPSLPTAMRIRRFEKLNNSTLAKVDKAQTQINKKEAKLKILAKTGDVQKINKLQVAIKKLQKFQDGELKHRWNKIGGAYGRYQKNPLIMDALVKLSSKREMKEEELKRIRSKK